MLNAAIKPFTVSVVMPNVVMLSVVAPFSSNQDSFVVQFDTFA
jgi:hypothetical protein